MKKVWIVLFCAVFSSAAFADISSNAEIIFRPGPGLNDGTDQGGEYSGKDAYAGSCNSPADNYGDNKYLYSAPVSNCNGCNAKAFIQFDVSSLPENVSHVYLGFTHLPHTSYCYSNCAADFYFYPISSSWDEMGVNLNNTPSHGSSVVGPIHITFPNNLGNQEYDITDIYRQWKNGTTPNYGIEISSPTVGCNNASVFFGTYSSDEGNESKRPYLRIITTDDGDGVPASVENAAPNGGDGNADGIADSEQQNVTSLPSATNEGYITLVASGGCNIINNVKAVMEPIPDTAYTYPFGLVEFRLPCSSATLRIYFHGSSDLGGKTYRKYGPVPPSFADTQWYTLPGVSYGIEEIAGNTVAYAEFTLADGQLGDDTDIDNLIVDQGGPAQPAAVPIPTLTEWGMMIFLFLIGIVVMIQMRRRHRDNTL